MSGRNGTAHPDDGRPASGLPADSAAGEPGDSARVPDGLIASALEFAVGIAAAGARLKPALPFPAELRPFLKFQKLPAKALASVRAAVEGDQVFLGRLASVATPELLDEAGMLWLVRPEGWATRLAELAAADGGLDAAAELRRAERRREGAEQVAQRAVAEIAALRAELERHAAEVARLTAEVARGEALKAALEDDLARVRNEARRANDQVRAAVDRADRARADADEAEHRASAAEPIRDEVLAARAGWMTRAGADETVLQGAAQLAADLDEQVVIASQLARVLGKLSDELAGLEPGVRPASVDASGGAGRGSGRRARTPGGRERRPIALPGGVYGSSSAAAEFYARHPGVAVLVDGYNVAKLGWPQLDLERQRERSIDAAEDIVRRFGTNVVVVFDGAMILGASAPGRRLVRVQFSAEGVSADDVLRAEVAALPVDVPVVVVTNDQAVAQDVRQHGASTMSSEQWLALAGRRGS